MASIPFESHLVWVLSPHTILWRRVPQEVARTEKAAHGAGSFCEGKAVGKLLTGTGNALFQVLAF